MINKANASSRDQHIPNSVVTVANFFLILGAILSLCMLPTVIYKFHYVRKANPLLVWAGFTSAIASSGLFITALRLKPRMKVNITLVTVSAIISVYTVELYLTISQLKDQLTQPIVMGDPASIDKQGKLEVVRELREDGVDAYPSFIPGTFWTETHLQNKDIYPLGGISERVHVLCKEDNYWAKYESDEHGFRNPKGLYEPGKVDIAIIGDSFAEGACVHSDKTIAAVLRRWSYRVLNFGKSMNGPLLEFATLTEYARPLTPQIVLWLYYEENDLTDLNREASVPLLMKYFTEDRFSQDLTSRQNEIDEVLMEYVQHGMAAKDNEIMEAEGNAVAFDLNSILELDHLREKLHLTLPTPTIPPPPIFKQIMKRADEMVSKWGGKLYFVYLPGHQRYRVDESFLYRDPKARDEVLKTITELDISLIDIHREVFAPHADPRSFFIEHYNEAGYRLVADAIAAKLWNDGFR